MTQRPNSNIDGFISKNNGRQVGFNGYGGAVRGRTISPQTRVRRPGLHGSATPAAAPVSRGSQSYSSTGRNGVSANNNPLNQSVPRRGMAGGFGAGNNAFPDDSGSQPRRPSTGRRRRGQKPGKDQQPLSRRAKIRKVLKRASFIALALMLVGAGWFGWKIFQNSQRVFGDGNILGFLNASKLKGEDQGRTNILLAGVSTDDAGHDGANLTDSIMLISIGTKDNKAFMLSIPRDLWVDIPSYGHSKINAANAYGDNDGYTQPGYPDGGMGLLEQTVAENLEIPVHYYAKINYSALRDAVNAVGGVSVNIQSSDKRGLYDPNISKADQGPLKLPNGVQTLDGQTALNLARARGDPTRDGRIAYGYEKSDFTRTQNQRMLLLALKEKIASSSTLANPVKLSELLDTIGKNTKTDLQPGEIRRLYDLGKLIDSKNIQSLSLNDANGKNLLASYTSSDGASALIPAAGLDDFSDIQLYIKKAMSNDSSVQESASIVVLNGGDITGLAGKYSNVLTSKGFDVQAVGDAEPQPGATKIIDTSQGKKPATKSKLQSIFKNSTVSATNDTGYDADFIIVLGSDQKAPASTGGNGN